MILYVFDDAPIAPVYRRGTGREWRDQPSVGVLTAEAAVRVVDGAVRVRAVAALCIVEAVDSCVAHALSTGASEVLAQLAVSTAQFTVVTTIVIVAIITVSSRSYAPCSIGVVACVTSTRTIAQHCVAAQAR